MFWFELHVLGRVYIVIYIKKKKFACKVALYIKKKLL